MNKCVAEFVVAADYIHALALVAANVAEYVHILVVAAVIVAGHSHMPAAVVEAAHKHVRGAVAVAVNSHKHVAGLDGLLDLIVAEYIQVGSACMIAVFVAAAVASRCRVQ